MDVYVIANVDALLVNHIDLFNGPYHANWQVQERIYNAGHRNLAVAEIMHNNVTDDFKAQAYYRDELEAPHGTGRSMGRLLSTIGVYVETLTVRLIPCSQCSERGLVYEIETGNSNCPICSATVVYRDYISGKAFTPNGGRKIDNIADSLQVGVKPVRADEYDAIIKMYSDE